MALTCDFTSMSSSDKPLEENPDIEDGEITDDDEETTPPEPTPQQDANPATAGAQPTILVIPKSLGHVSDSESLGAPAREGKELEPRDKSSDRLSDDKDRFSDGRERDRGKGKEGRKSRDRLGKDKSNKHMTEAERSILHLRKREKMLRQREKWDKHQRKEADPLDDDFAKNIEKTLATILSKKEKEAASLSAGEEGVQEDDKKGKKRKKECRDKEKSKKHKRLMDSPRSEIDESEMLNIRSGSPGADRLVPPQSAPYGPDHRRPGSVSRSEESYNSEYSSDEREERRRRSQKMRRKKENKRERKRDRDQRRHNRDDPSKMPLQDAQGVCVFYLQGKCQKNDCPYSHEVSPPMKLELCKFYLMDCCAKGENCSYMHSEFPCKFYHTGLPCIAGKDCKFAHGRPLSEGLKQILFKHIETAPRDILQGFPRLSRDEALNLINQTQKKLVEQHGKGSSDQHNTSSTASTSHTDTPSTAQQQKQTYGGATGSSAGMGMYRDRDEYSDNSRDVNEKEEGGVKEGKMNKNERGRNKNSRWMQDQGNFSAKSFNYGNDQDMRFMSNGDVDMRTLPAIPSTTSGIPEANLSMDPCTYQKDGQLGDLDIRTFTQDVDIRKPPFSRNMSQNQSMDVDIRQRSFDGAQNDSNENTKGDSKQGTSGGLSNFQLPPATRDLLARINANQKDSTLSLGSSVDNQQQSTMQPENYDDQNINWYSDDDDDDDNRLTIKVEDEEVGRRERQDSTDSTGKDNKEDQSTEQTRSSFLSPPHFSLKTADIVGKLGDLSKIDISDEVTKLLTSMNKNKTLPTPDNGSTSAGSNNESKREGSFSPRGFSTPSDPRVARQAKSDSRQDLRPQDPRQDNKEMNDPRHRGRQNSSEGKEKGKNTGRISIYEQGGLDMKKAALEIDSEDFRSLRPDIDLRNMTLPFKGMQNYTPATEIDASIKSHVPMFWKLAVVEIPRPDYTGLKLSISDAEKTGDPRLRKIFRLSIDEKESPASPKASPKQNVSGGARIDPRLRKTMEEKAAQDLKDSPQHPGQMSYTQQLSMLRSSQFYQSLTSNQKLMLNQELASHDQSGGGGTNDPVLSTLLSTLNLLPQTSQAQGPMVANSHLGAAASILSNVTKMNPLIPNQPLIGQQGLLGAAPGIPNLPPNMTPGMPSDFPMNFDPRGAPGLLGNAPPGPGFNQFGGMDQTPFGGGGFNDDFYGSYEEQGNMGPQGPQMGNFRPGRGGFNNRDGRRRGNNREGGFRGGRGGNRNFHKRGGRDKGDRSDRGDRERGGRGNRGHSPS